MGMSAAHCQGNVREFQSVWRVVTLVIISVAVAEKYGSVDTFRRCHILMCLRDMAAANECHKIAINGLFSSPKFAHLPVPQLYRETFVGIDDDDDDYGLQKSETSSH